MRFKEVYLVMFIFLFMSLKGPAFSRETTPAHGKPTIPAAKLYDAVIDINGTGDYKTLQQAIDHAPAGRTQPWKIFIKNGRYEGLVRIPENKPFIYLIGQNKDKVIISFKINCGNPDREQDAGKQFSKVYFKQRDCAVVVVEAPDFYAENISFENGYGVEFQSGPQALAIKISSDRTAFFNCKFRSFQDTWMTSTKGKDDRTYADSCWIEGAVDYFYGGGDAFVENSTFYNVRSGSVIVAPSHKEGTKWGYVFMHCTIDGNAAAAEGRSKLGRPWHDRPIAVFLNTIMKIPLAPEGWTDMGPAAKLFAEYNSRDAQGRLIDLSQRRTWYKQSAGEGGQRIEGLTSILTKEQAAKYTYENVLAGSDGWNPRAFFARLPQPVQLTLLSGRLHWNSLADAAGYIVFKDKCLIGFTKQPAFKLEAQKSGSYTIVGVSQNGSLGLRSDSIVLQ